MGRLIEKHDEQERAERTVKMAGLVLSAIALTLILCAGAGAQYDYDDLWDMDDYYERQERTRRHHERQDQLLEDMLEQAQPSPENDEYESWDRLRALEGCNALTNNPAAQQRCFETLP